MNNQAVNFSPKTRLAVFVRFAFLLGTLISCSHHIRAQSTIDHWETVVYSDDIWKYHLGDSSIPTNWYLPSFNDSAWSSAPGGFGYGDNDDQTIVPTTPSVFLRKNFTLSDTSVIEMAILHADYDDAFVAFLNGHEIGRGNFDDGPAFPSYDDMPSTDHEAALYRGILPESFAIYPEQFKDIIVEGNNVLTIQVHNFLLSSSDLSSNFFLSLAIADSSQNFGPTPAWFFEPFLGSNLPLVRIVTDSLPIVDEPKVTANLQIVDNGTGAFNYRSDPSTGYNGRIAIEIRGSSSQMFPKKNYGFETQDSNGDNNNVSLLGMPAENDWILYGPFSDKSLMRNALTFDIGRDIMPYASRTRFCELLIDGDYRGVYLLMEKIKRDDHRVDISKLLETDIIGDELTGGYIIKIDRDDPEVIDDGWYSSYGSNPFYAYHSPDYDQLAPEQKVYIRNWMSSFEAAMNQSSYASTYDTYIDVESFIDYFLINELTKHIDAFKLSFYMYKKKNSEGGKLYMGPIWDFNLGYGNFDFGCSPDPDGWIYECTSRAFWLDKILTIPAVQEQMACRWHDLRNSVLSDAALISRIDSMRFELGVAVDQNFEEYDILGSYVWPNSFIGVSYNAEVAFLKNWLLQRVDWMDNNMLGGSNPDCLPPSSIDERLSNNTSSNVYPNPADDVIRFEGLETSNDHIYIDIINAQGQIVKKVVLSNGEFFIDVSSLAPGIYIYHSRSNQQYTFGQFLKN